MRQDFEDEPGAEERAALGRLAREKAPPPGLEDRVVEALKREKLIRPRVGRGVRAVSAPRAWLAVAASLLIFALGALAGARWVAGQGKTGAPEFMLVLRSSNAQSGPPAPEEVARRVREYGDWAGRLRRQGVRVEGERLAREARLLRGAGAGSSENGPVSETIAGYFLIEARDFDEAVRLAEGCPHLKYGGSVEVRQVARF
ncbi:MAG TPA: YciI family protein [Pyrinomonadaceae bacterium]|nr:YciI family protein [Pyrinomonadaceae bacterium]